MGSQDLARLTKTAFLFIPFSTVAGVFSIQDVRSKLWIYVLIVLPIFVISVALISSRGVTLTAMGFLVVQFFRHTVPEFCRGWISRFKRKEKRYRV